MSKKNKKAKFWIKGVYNYPSKLFLSCLGHNLFFTVKRRPTDPIWKWALWQHFVAQKFRQCILFAMFGFTFTMTYTDQHIFRHIDFTSCCFPSPRQWCWSFRTPKKLLVIFVVTFFHQQETHSTLNKQPNKQLSKKGRWLYSTLNNRAKTKVSSATSQMTSSPRSPCAAFSQASLGQSIRWRSRDKRENSLCPRDSKLTGRAE